MDLNKYKNKIPSILRNKFVLVALGYFIYMMFFDSNDIPSQFKLRKHLKGLEKQHNYYAEKIKEVEKERQQLFSNIESMEKFAREKYWMKKENEDLYIILEK